MFLIKVGKLYLSSVYEGLVALTDESNVYQRPYLYQTLKKATIARDSVMKQTNLSEDYVKIVTFTEVE